MDYFYFNQLSLNQLLNILIIYNSQAIDFFIKKWIIEYQKRYIQNNNNNNNNININNLLNQNINNELFNHNLNHICKPPFVQNILNSYVDNGLFKNEKLRNNNNRSSTHNHLQHCQLEKILILSLFVNKYYFDESDEEYQNKLYLFGEQYLKFIDSTESILEKLNQSKDWDLEADKIILWVENSVKNYKN